MEIRWNLIIFGGGLMLTMLAVLGFAAYMLTDKVVVGNEEMVVVGILALLATSVGYVGGYATGVMQALSGPSDPAPTVTETTHKEIVELVAGKDDE